MFIGSEQQPPPNTTPEEIPTMSIEKEILKLTKVKANKKDRQATLTAALEAMTDESVVSEEQVEALSEPANAWLKGATEAYNADQPLPDFAEFEAEEVEEAPAKKKKLKTRAKAETSEEAEEAPVKKTKKKAAKKAAAAEEEEAEEEAPAKKTKKKAAKGGAKNETRKRTNSMQAARLILIKNPALDVAELCAAVAAETGLDIQEKTARSLRYHTLSTLKDMRRLNLTVTDKKGKTINLPE